MEVWQLPMVAVVPSYRNENRTDADATGSCSHFSYPTPFSLRPPSIASIHPTVPTRFTPSRIAQLRTNNSIITDDISFNTATSICAVYMRALRFAAKSLPSLMGTRLQNFESNSLEFQCQPFVFSNVQTETGSRFVSDRVEDRGNECKSKVRTTGKKCEITVLGI
jgi:hypothetical protein